MTIDFFVHPEHDSEEYPSKNVHAGYRENLLKVLDSSRLPILVNGLFPSGVFEEKIPKENQFSSSYWLFDFPVNCGEINPDSWKKFEDLIKGHERDSMRIHGANFGECTEGFAVQLFAYLQRGEHWNNWDFFPSYPGNESKFRKERKLRRMHEKVGDFARSNIRYGVVLHPQRKINIISESRFKFASRYPYGNITHQLMDDNTLVYRLPK